MRGRGISILERTYNINNKGTRKFFIKLIYITKVLRRTMISINTVKRRRQELTDTLFNFTKRMF